MYFTYTLFELESSESTFCKSLLPVNLNESKSHTQLEFMYTQIVCLQIEHVL